MSEPGDGAIEPGRVLALLAEGAIDVIGALPNSSNNALVVRVSAGEERIAAVYKPRDGENPLWDFPDGTLWQREIAAYRVSDRLGFSFVPPTVSRLGPYGPGSLQLFVDHDPSMHYLNMPPEFDDVFRRVCLFDLLINNADRKAGHCLYQPATGLVWMVDHGVTFNEATNLRTVIWDFAGEPMPADGLAAIRSFAAELETGSGLLDGLLSDTEIQALRHRADRIVAAGVFPEPGPGRPYPWPPV